jgi:hypothetical protein
VTDDRPIYVIRVRARPGVDAVAALRQVLRRLLRSYGLVCVSVGVEHAEAKPSEPGPVLTIPGRKSVRLPRSDEVPRR